MSSSRAALFTGEIDRLETWNVPTPTPRGGELLARVLGCTLCGSDLHTISGRRAAPTPSVLGHEIVGEIVALGETAPRFDWAGAELRVGDRVTWAVVANCGDCFYCQRDLPQKCLQGVKYGHEPARPGLELRGGLAEHCLLAPGTALVRLADTLPLEAACPASCAAATSAAALEAGGFSTWSEAKPPDPWQGASSMAPSEQAACVLGAGLLGLTLCAMLRAAGVGEVICVDLQPARRALAPRFGAHRACAPEELAAVLGEARRGLGVDALFECTGAPAAFESAWPLARMGGRVVLVGAVYPAPPVSLTLENIVRRQITLRGVHNYAPRHLLAATRFLEACQARHPFADLVAGWWALDELPGALRMARDPNTLRVGVRPTA